MKYDTIIIGAGMSGLAAGIRLARYGGKTLILERHYRIGGLNSWYRAGGYYVDVGLHAMTNYNADRNAKNTPLAKLLRQLRLRFDELELVPQRRSKVIFPGITLDFDNDFETFAESVARAFPAQVDNFRKLVTVVKEYDDLNLELKPVSGREVIASYITDPLLVDMLLCPTMFYGSSDENDMEFGQFVIIFKSVFVEGLSRPARGIKPILDILEKRFTEAGGEIRLRCGAKNIITEKGRVAGVETEDGKFIECDAVISSAGFVETVSMCHHAAPEGTTPVAGELSFMESVNVLNTSLPDWPSIAFFNTADRFAYRRPDDPVDTSSGVICFPSSFAYDTPPEPPMIRVTNIADHRFWTSANEDIYVENKALWRDRSLNVVENLIPGFRDGIVFSDVFTPRTIRNFTGHVHGAVYGSPAKMRNGHTAVKNLYLCGTDQGFLGIVGAMLSGVTVANLRLLEMQSR